MNTSSRLRAGREDETSGATQGDAMPEIPDLPDRSAPVITTQSSFVSDQAA